MFSFLEGALPVVLDTLLAVSEAFSAEPSEEKKPVLNLLAIAPDPELLLSLFSQTETERTDSNKMLSVHPEMLWKVFALVVCYQPARHVELFCQWLTKENLSTIENKITNELRNDRDVRMVMMAFQSKFAELEMFASKNPIKQMEMIYLLQHRLQMPLLAYQRELFSLAPQELFAHCTPAEQKACEIFMKGRTVVRDMRKQKTVYVSKCLHVELFGQTVDVDGQIGFAYEVKSKDLTHMQVALRSYQDFDEFAAAVDSYCYVQNRVLAKLDEANPYALVLAEDNARARIRASQLAKSLPILIYDNGNKQLRVYSQHEQKLETTLLGAKCAIDLELERRRQVKPGMFSRNKKFQSPVKELPGKLSAEQVAEMKKQIDLASELKISWQEAWVQVQALNAPKRTVVKTLSS